MADELTDAQREELWADLRQLQVTLRETMDVTDDLASVVELDQAAMGRVSRIDAIQQQKMAQAQKQRNAQRIEQIRVALMDEDDYGWCRKCGEPIGYGRLKARPESVFCVACLQGMGR